MKKQLNICLTWHNLNSENFGVSALAITHIEFIIQAAKNKNIDISITTFGTPDTKHLKIRDELEQKHKLRINHINFSPRNELNNLINLKKSALFKLREYDIIFDLGEGDSFTDIYGQKRFAFLCLTKLLPILNKTPLILSPQTIGPFKSKVNQKLAGWMLKRADNVFCRDVKSSAVARELGARPTETTDVAFSLSYTPLEKKPNNVGVNISALLWHGGYNKKNQFNLTLDYQEIVRQIISGLLQRNQTVHLIPHVISENILIENDYLVCQEIKSLYANDERIILSPKFSSPIEAKSYISQLEFFTGARMHATIGAVSAGVPTIPIAYSRKFVGVFGTLNYNYTLEANTLNEERLLTSFFNYFDQDKEEMYNRVKQSGAQAKKENDTYILNIEKILEELAHKLATK